MAEQVRARRLSDQEGRRLQQIVITLATRGCSVLLSNSTAEEITDVDLVQAQMRIASGETLDDLGLSQDDVRRLVGRRM